MTDKKVEAAIAYCRAWLECDKENFLSLLAPNIVVVECYGPEYRGMQECEDWFTDWHVRGGKVLAWDIKRAGAYDDGACLKWYFECLWEGQVTGFDGTTLFDFDAQGRIVRIEEYQSKTDHIRPYMKD